MHIYTMGSDWMVLYCFFEFFVFICRQESNARDFFVFSDFIFYLI